MSNNLNNILNKIENRFERPTLVENNWNLSLERENNNFTEVNEKFRNDFRFNTVNLNNIQPLTKANFTYNGNPNDINSKMILTKYETKKIIESELNPYLYKAKKEIEKEKKQLGDQITLNKNNEIKINDIYLNLSFYKNRISKIDNQIEFMKEKLNNTKLNVKNESEDLKKGIEKTNNDLNNLENNFLYLENKIREIVDNQKKINISVNESNKMMAEEIMNKYQDFYISINNSIGNNNNNFLKNIQNFKNENDKKFQSYKDEFENLKNQIETFQNNYLNKDNEVNPQELEEKFSEDFNKVNSKFDVFEKQNKSIIKTINEINGKIDLKEVNDNNINNKFKHFSFDNLVSQVNQNEELLNELNSKILEMENLQNPNLNNIDNIKPQIESINKKIEGNSNLLNELKEKFNSININNQLIKNYSNNSYSINEVKLNETINLKSENYYKIINNEYIKIMEKQNNTIYQLLEILHKNIEEIKNQIIDLKKNEEYYEQNFEEIQNGFDKIEYIYNKVPELEEQISYFKKLIEDLKKMNKLNHDEVVENYDKVKEDEINKLNHDEERENYGVEKTE
jgi:chromosome segregation ATPase